jgi:hypothetical protein
VLGLQCGNRQAATFFLSVRNQAARRGAQIEGAVNCPALSLYVADGGNLCDAAIQTIAASWQENSRPIKRRWGFYDLALAAPSMKAALEAWGAESNLFHQGVAKESKDPEVVAATMAKPGVILRHPVGSNGPFTEHAGLPTDLADGEVNGRPNRPRGKPKKQPPRKSMTRQSARSRCWSTREPRGSAKGSAGKKRPRGRRSGNVASRRSPRRGQHSKRPNGTMTPGQAPLRPSGPPWKSARKPRTAVGRSRNRSWTSPCVGRGNKAMRADPPVAGKIPGAPPPR